MIGTIAHVIIFLVCGLFFYYGLSDLIIRVNYMVVSFLHHDKEVDSLIVKILAQVIIVLILLALTIWSALSIG